jgi:hypothetical protein
LPPDEKLSYREAVEAVRGLEEARKLAEELSDPRVLEALDRVADRLPTQEDFDQLDRLVDKELDEFGAEIDGLGGPPGTPEGPSGTLEAHLDEIRSDPESFYGTRGLTEAQIGAGMRSSSADLDQMSWEQMFDLMRNTSDPVYEHIEEEFMRRYNFLYGLKDEFADQSQPSNFLMMFPEMTYPPETFQDMIAFAVDPDIGTFGSDQADFITEVAREIDEWWGGFRGGSVDGPSGALERDLLDRNPGAAQREPFPETFTPDEIDQIVRNEGGLTDKEIRDLMGDTPNE